MANLPHQQYTKLSAMKSDRKSRLKKVSGMNIRHISPDSPENSNQDLYLGNSMVNLQGINDVSLPKIN